VRYITPALSRRLLVCTLIVSYNVFPGFPIVVAANRDELLDRPSEGPRLGISRPRILAPKDLQRGGTWLGMNEYSVFAAITNRIDVESKRNRVSRGELVRDAMLCMTAEQAREKVAARDGWRLNGFHLVIADRSDMFLLIGDGNTIDSSSQGDGTIVVTNHGIGRIVTEKTPRRVSHVLTAWQEYGIRHKTPTPESLRPLLDIHDDWRYGTCIHEPEENYGTKSSSVIRLDARTDVQEWQYWHRERTHVRRHICTESFGNPLTLALLPSTRP
jgi:uncharacterized protein with NRDE domain